MTTDNNKNRNYKLMRTALREACDWFDAYRPQWGPGTLPAWYVDAKALLASLESGRPADPST